MSGPPRSGVRWLANSGDVPSPYPSGTPDTQPRRRHNGRGCFHRVRHRGAARRTRRMELTVVASLSNRGRLPRQLIRNVRAAGPRMTILQRFSLLRRRFSPLEERLIAAVREVLPPQAQPTFDAQVAGITLVQR